MYDEHAESSPRLLLRIRLLANAVMTCTVVMTILVVPRLSLVPRRRVYGNVLRLAPEHKPWVLPERLVNDLSGETSLHYRIPLFDARLLHGLNISAGNFRAKEYFYLDTFQVHHWYSDNTKRYKSSLLQA